MDKELLESYPRTLIDQMLSKKVYSVMLSSPKVKQDAFDDETTDAENPPDAEDFMGIIEQRLSKILYGESGDPMMPSPKS